jgi:hypothetical protein
MSMQTQQEIEPKLDPKLFINKWKRFPQKLDFTRPNRFVIAGMPETGKSSLGEVIAARYNKNDDGKVLDLFSARDNEGLSWCRHDKFKNDVLLLHGDSVEVSSEWEEKSISKLKLKDLADHKTIISVPAFYGTLREEWFGIDRVMKILWRRTHWDKVWFINIREGTSLLYSRLSLGENQAQAKASFIYAIKEFRHCGMAMAIDIIRYYGLDTEVRTISDYTFIKAHGQEGLPKSIGWLYRYYDLFRDVMQMPPWVFILLTKKGGVGHGTFEYPYWHKEEKENILDILDIEVRYGMAINYGDRHKQVGDFEHVDIIRARIADGKASTSMQQLAEGGTYSFSDKEIKLQHRSTATIKKVVSDHNKDLKAVGYCPICRRAKAEVVDQKQA